VVDVNKTLESFEADHDFDIFVSYAREDEPRVEAIANYLADVGFRVFWDPRLNDFTPYKESLENHLDSCRYVLVCWSDSAVQSKWVKWEAQIALEAKKYLPITLDDTRPENDNGFHIRSIKNWHPTFRPREMKELSLNLARELGKEHTRL